jgi:anthranilate phosphoribosyltransferase
MVDLGVASHEPLLDTCGTGGDRAGTFNVSTVAAFVVAACGVKVAKHGNRAVSSRSGSADVLEALGARLELTEEEAQAAVRDVGMAFLFAPAHHGALRHAAPVRRALGLRTFFNLLGPLANPAEATHQLLGVYDPGRVRQMAEVLGQLGTRGAWVVHGAGGLDEVSPLGPTKVAVLLDGEVDERTVEPLTFGLSIAGPEAVAGGTPEDNAALARRLLSGERVPQRVTVVLNAAAALLAAGAETDPKRAAEWAQSALDSGAASDVLERYVARAPAARVPRR